MSDRNSAIRFGRMRWSDCIMVIIPLHSVGGGQDIPFLLNPLVVSFPKSYSTTPPRIPSGALTATSPRRISLVLLGIPPPMPTNKRSSIAGKVRIRWMAIAASDAVPGDPFGSDASTTLCPLKDPSTYVFGSNSSLGRPACSSSSIYHAALSSTSRGHINATVYAS
ncbi:hypothetical protein ASPBRDRAFT_654438 [Aspergillus brasiliensis CBS 101740]|uniref:Uncharacterized protein n=1 Tax=Aspergillus brasiliensis (strain CBS 101740 / IMI 381727 / IBT 21946) TaxID=767769 RepID=A0A1L9V0A5_ASPBC|nr:hypothetical protein ASPBRDRAFT_654438 [Aspergillus brasiliensis CBS 101740]